MLPLIHLCWRNLRTDRRMAAKLSPAVSKDYQLSRIVVAPRDLREVHQSPWVRCPPSAKSMIS